MHRPRLLCRPRFLGKAPWRQPGRGTAAALAGLAMTGWVLPAMAQPAQGPGAPPPPGMAGPPPEGRMRGPGFGPGPMAGPMAGPGMHHMHHHHDHQRGGPFGGLVYRREDKQLTVPEVQRIAEGLLLLSGERSWKITEAREGRENTVEFALATAEGSVIARFAMDRRSGRMWRIG